MLNILHVVLPTLTGGLERVVETLTVGHQRLGHRVTVGAILLGGQDTHPFVEALTSHGVDVRILHMTPRAYLTERRLVADLCRLVSPDVVHTHGYRCDVVDRSVAARLGIPTITTVHGRDLREGAKGRFYEWLHRRSHRRFDAVVTVSTVLHREALDDGVAGERLHYIPNAWGGLREPLGRGLARQELGIDEEARVIGWVGRLVPVKGADIFLEAVSRLKEPRPLAVMIGHGKESEDLRRRAHELGIDHTVRFYPQIRDAGRLFRAFDTYILSSRSEGQPIVILEAMAAGTPIVATRVGGLPDMIGGGEAWLVAPDDSAALAVAIEASLRDRREALDRAELARLRLASDFALGPWLERYEAVYWGLVRQRVLTGAGGPG